MAKKQLFISIIGLVVVATAIFSCDTINEKVLPRLTGKSGNLLVVVDSFYWNHKTGEAIMETFAKEQVGLPQREPLFDIIFIPHKSFAQIFKTNRNIIIVEVKPNTKNKLSINSDVWSTNQLIVSITASSDELAAETIRKNGNVLVNYFNDKEIERLQNRLSLGTNPQANEVLKQKFNIKLTVESNFHICSRYN